MQNIFENYIVRKKCLIKAWTWFFPITASFLICETWFFSCCKKHEGCYKSVFKDILFHWIEKKNKHMDKYLMQNTCKFREDVQ